MRHPELLPMMAEGEFSFERGQIFPTHFRLWSDAAIAERLCRYQPDKVRMLVSWSQSRHDRHYWDGHAGPKGAYVPLDGEDIARHDGVLITVAEQDYQVKDCLLDLALGFWPARCIWTIVTRRQVQRTLQNYILRPDDRYQVWIKKTYTNFFRLQKKLAAKQAIWVLENLRRDFPELTVWFGLEEKNI